MQGVGKGKRVMGGAAPMTHVMQRGQNGAGPALDEATSMAAAYGVRPSPSSISSSRLSSI